MKRNAFGLLALAVVVTGCTKDDETGDTGPTTCDNSIVETFPVDGETQAYYRTTVEVKFDDAETDATITVSGPGGDVAGTETWVEDRWVFTPSAALSPSTTYTVSISYSCGDPSVSFTTSEVGGSTTPGDLVGNSYVLDLASGRFVEPEGVGSLLQDFLTQGVLIGVTAADATSIQMIGAIADVDSGSGELVQEACEPSIPFPAADFTDNPFFSVGPETTTISVAGFSIEIENLLIEGAFAPGGEYISGAKLAGRIDTEPLVPLLDPGCDDPQAENFPCDPLAICALAGSIGVSCEDCDGDTGTTDDVTCLSLLVDSIAAEAYVDSSDNFIPVEELHEPDRVDPPVSSTNYCTKGECSGQEECMTSR